jgi:hypothetical protein
MTTSLAPTVDGSESSFDVRWARWQEGGAVQARALEQRAAVAAVLTFCALATWLVISVYLTQP